jgi:hypothetical protein
VDHQEWGDGGRTRPHHPHDLRADSLERSASPTTPHGGGKREGIETGGAFRLEGKTYLVQDGDIPTSVQHLADGARMMTAAEDLARFIETGKFGAILADPPWQFENRTGKVAPELDASADTPPCPSGKYWTYPWPTLRGKVPPLSLGSHALLPDGLTVMEAWGFAYKSNIVWQKITQGRGPDGPRRRFLLPERDGTPPLRDQGGTADSRARAESGERHSSRKAGAFPQAGGAV